MNKLTKEFNVFDFTSKSSLLRASTTNKLLLNSIRMDISLTILIFVDTVRILWCKWEIWESLRDYLGDIFMDKDSYLSSLIKLINRWIGFQVPEAHWEIVLWRWNKSKSNKLGKKVFMQKNKSPLTRQSQ